MLCFISLTAECIHILFGNLHKIPVYSLSFIYSVICWYQKGIILYSLVIIQYYFIYFLAQIVPVLDIRISFSCPFDILPHVVISCSGSRQLPSWPGLEPGPTLCCYQCCHMCLWAALLLCHCWCWGCLWRLQEERSKMRSIPSSHLQIPNKTPINRTWQEISWQEILGNIICRLETTHRRV